MARSPCRSPGLIGRYWRFVITVYADAPYPSQGGFEDRLGLRAFSLIAGQIESRIPYSGCERSTAPAPEYLNIGGNVIDSTLYVASTWVIPALLAITLHEAAHGYVAKLRGDDTAWQLGRVSFNPLKHVDPFGTILLPALLLLTHAPFLFGYAKPVPVRFDRLRNPRRDMVWVAAAGPAMNLALAILAALLVHIVAMLSPELGRWFLANLANAIELNVILALFNLIPIPPLDGGRIAVGLLPNVLAAPLARLGRYGM